jgi:hypothetical protein
MFHRMIAMFYHQAGITDKYQTIPTLNNAEIAKACF